MKCRKPQEAYIFEYPQAVEFAEQQNEIFWTATEIAVEKDVHDIATNMTEAERHGVITVLKLFTLYELFAGKEYWGDRVMKTFPKPCINRMASAFSYFELNVHAPFYNKLNEALHLNTEEFYTSYVNDPILKERMDFIDSVVNDPNDLLSLGVFSMVEGAVLYSSFAFLKHFQSKGKNKLLNVVRGINFSVRDENLHCQGGAWLYNTLKKETMDEEPDFNIAEIEDKIIECAHKLYEHECHIVEMIFEKGAIEGITKAQMRNFIQSRINICIKQLGINHIFKVSRNTIADWFYDGINGYKMNDFFTGIGSEYNRNWNEGGFKW